MNNLEKKLEQELDRGFDELSRYDASSQEYTKASDNIAKLYKIRMEEVQNSAEYWNKIETNEAQIKEQRIDHAIRYGLEAVGITLPLVVYASLFKKGLIFKKDGVIGSTIFRNLISKGKIGK